MSELCRCEHPKHSEQCQSIDGCWCDTFSTKPTLDPFTAKHLRSWIENKYLPEHQSEAQKAIYAALAEYPSLLEQGRSWGEIERMGRAAA